MQNKLDSTGSVALSNWICRDLVEYDRKVSQFRLANPWYIPTLSKWVTPATWIRISEDMLDAEDKTEGGPPNDVAVEAFLRSEGKYEGRRQHGGKIIQGRVKHRLEALVYKTKSSHIKAYEHYMDQWNKIVRSLREVERPKAKLTAKIILAAIQPESLRKRIVAKTWDGLGPEYLSDEFQKWRQQVKTDARLLRNLIRENADYWDRMGLKDEFAMWGKRKTRGTPSSESRARNPECELDGCTNKVYPKRKRMGGGFFKYCLDHKQHEPTYRKRRGDNQPSESNNDSTNSSNNGTGTSASRNTSRKQTVSEEDKKLIDIGECNAPSCNAKRGIGNRGQIYGTCGKQECRDAWEAADKPYTNGEPCRLCGSKDHKVLQCEDLTQEYINKLTTEHKYDNSFRFWNSATNILAARKVIFGDIKPQHMQSGSSVYKYAHGKAIIGPSPKADIF